MDPTATLRQARAQMRAAIAAGDADADSDIIGGFLADACEAFAALDEWLSNGGFLPADWQEATRDNPCPFTFAHTRHWCGYKTCRDS